MKNIKLYVRVLIAVVLLTSALTVCLDVAGAYIIKNYMMDKFKSRIHFLAKYFALNAEIGVLIKDRAGLNTLALNILSEEDVSQVMVFDEKGLILANQSRKIPGKLYIVETKIKLNKRDDESILFKSYRYTPFGTLTIPGIESIGKVKIKYSTRGIDQLVKIITKQFAAFSIVLTFIALVIFYFIVRKIVVDVENLAAVSKRIGDGAYDIRAQAGNLPETIELAYAFNNMLDSLAHSRESYERVLKDMASQRYLAELGKFSLSIAHEVKNPLAIIKSSFDFIKRQYNVPPADTMAEYVDDEINRLNKLIEDFLIFGKPVKIDFQNLDVTNLLKKLCRRYEILYEDIPIDFRFVCHADNMFVRADEGLLVRVFDNIIKNAVEENSKKGIVFIKSYAENDSWMVEISDHGGGFDSGEEMKIFEPFYTTKAKGTGLGLTLAFQIIKAHNGTLAATNIYDMSVKGGKLIIELPIVKE